MTLRLGDCVEVMAGLEEASVDAVVCDPPYGIGFMNKGWDRPDADAWGYWAGSGKRPSNAEAAAFQAWSEAWARAALRVLRPGGHLVAFGGSRTYHRLACAVEDAGFEVRDQLMWLFGEGFPKSFDVSKALDKAAGHVGEHVQVDHPGRAGVRERVRPRDGQPVIGQFYDAEGVSGGLRHLYRPGSELGRRWAGWGTALKPAHEPILLARRSLAGSIVDNVRAHGVGPLNVDGCRISGAKPARAPLGPTEGRNTPIFRTESRSGAGETYEGRWPPNLVLSHAKACERVGTAVIPGRRPVDQPYDAPNYRNTVYGRGMGGTGHPGFPEEEVDVWRCAPECPVRQLDEATAELHQAGNTRLRDDVPAGEQYREAEDRWVFPRAAGSLPAKVYPDFGGASRFYYTSKAHGDERWGWCKACAEAFPWSRYPAHKGHDGLVLHPTVKPVDLIRWLVRLVAPEGALVLDPFAGTGTTGVACHLERRRFLGVERDPDYHRIASARLGADTAQPWLF